MNAIDQAIAQINAAAVEANDQERVGLGIALQILEEIREGLHCR